MYKDTDIFVVSYPKSGTTWMQYILALGYGEDVISLKDLIPSIDIGERKPSKLDPAIYKTHFHCSTLPNANKKIYMLRNPFDVCVSQYHHTKAKDMNKFVEDFIVGKAGRFGGWKEHTQDAKNCQNILTVKYEDLISNFGQCMDNLSKFLDVKFNSYQLEQKTSFKEMKANADKLSPIPHNKNFFRVGQVHNYKQELNQTQIRKIEEYSKLEEIQNG